MRAAADILPLGQSKGQVVLVCGGRDFSRRAVVFGALRKMHDEQRIVLIVTGAASGADELAEAWARSSEIDYRGCPARWSQEGRAAGPRRNDRMLGYLQSVRHGNAIRVVAFPGGRGTADMVRRAREAGIEVVEVRP